MATSHLKVRFEKMEWQQQLGNLASTLGRLSSSVVSSKNDDYIINLFQEAALFIEWAAPNVPEPHLLELATMQKELLALKQAWPIPGIGAFVALYARNRSDRLLEITGLVRAR